ncbi:ATP-binding protein [Kribbella sindirgiensis]|uniref:ATP-binding protein n=1 Tax=Kribbella sindirgiensis TaxID=1124744 RepID=A0A4R0J1Q9_9ACTN|nr:ATP-binding protein [Kribbella sindirgiensis]TCC35075.1 ATP-binding protein [Kribbella sindirgiensis]
MAYGSPFSPRPGAATVAPRGRGTETALARRFVTDVAHAQVETNGLMFAGSRGIGKSTLLRGLATDLRSMGWRVAEVRVSESLSANEALRDSLDSARMRGGARFRDPVRNLRKSVRGASLSVGLRGPSASVDIERPDRGPQIAKLVVDAGEQARRAARPAVIVIDDLDRWSPSQLRQLCEGLSECSRARHPVGVIAAGSAAADADLAKADRGQVFDVARLDVLNPSEASAVLRDTAATVGGSFDQRAHDTVVNFSQGHPLRLQLAAHEAWRAAPHGALHITGQAAQVGVERARAKLDRQIHGAIWNSLPRSEQVVMQTLADGHPTQSRTSIEARLSAGPRVANVESAVAALIRKNVVKEIPDGRIAFTDPGTAEWVLRNRPPAGSANHVLQASPPAKQIGSAQSAASAQPTRPATLGRSQHSTNPTNER